MHNLSTFVMATEAPPKIAEAVSASQRKSPWQECFAATSNNSNIITTIKIAPKRGHLSSWLILIIAMLCSSLPATNAFQSIHTTSSRLATTTTATTTFTSSRSPALSAHNGIDLNQLDRDLKKCSTGTAARRVLASALLSPPDNAPSTTTTTTTTKALYQSISIPPDASQKGLSDGDLAIMTRIRNTRYSILELIDLNGNSDADRASLAVLSVFCGSTLSALVAQENLPGPEILRFLVVWLFSFAPFVLVGYGIADASQWQALLVTIQRTVFPVYRQRMLQHEAGHVLMSHLLGFPIEAYEANAVKNAVTFYPFGTDVNAGADRARLLGFDKGVERPEEQQPVIRAETKAPFFSPEGRGSSTLREQSVFRQEALSKKTNYTAFLTLDNTLDKTMEPRESWPYRGFDDATLDQLTVISVAGVCAEILAFGNAEGGLADFNQLKQLLLAKQRTADDDDAPLTEREVDNRIRYALGFTMAQLRRHLGALDALVEVMARDGSIAECVYAIETCPNVSGNDGIVVVDDYEQKRKEKFATNNPLVILLERILIGEPKTADMEEDRFIEGKGGGYKKSKEPLLTGDDPLYLALGIASLFLLWASSGGLSLH